MFDYEIYVNNAFIHNYTSSVPVAVGDLIWYSCKEGSARYRVLSVTHSTSYNNSDLETVRVELACQKL